MDPLGWRYVGSDHSELFGETRMFTLGPLKLVICLQPNQPGLWHISVSRVDKGYPSIANQTIVQGSFPAGNWEVTACSAQVHQWAYTPEEAN